MDVAFILSGLLLELIALARAARAFSVLAQSRLDGAPLDFPARWRLIAPTLYLCLAGFALLAAGVLKSTPES